ncbi:penicillin acylase family protein, partial [Candidatus Microgenomates bacterium]|nr:penicillin acylase family protein [Candidatus Microgenomates bacterium]
MNATGKRSIVLSLAIALGLVAVLIVLALARGGTSVAVAQQAEAVAAQQAGQELQLVENPAEIIAVEWYGAPSFVPYTGTSLWLGFQVLTDRPTDNSLLLSISKSYSVTSIYHSTWSGNDSCSRVITGTTEDFYWCNLKSAGGTVAMAYVEFSGYFTVEGDWSFIGYAAPKGGVTVSTTVTIHVGIPSYPVVMVMPDSFSETVTQTGYMPTDPFTGVWGPVYRMVSDLGDQSNSRWQITTGQSGQPGSRHYDDMIDAWTHGRTNPVYLDEQRVRTAGGAKHLRLEP